MARNALGSHLQAVNRPMGSAVLAVDAILPRLSAHRLSRVWRCAGTTLSLTPGVGKCSPAQLGLTTTLPRGVLRFSARGFSADGSFNMQQEHLTDKERQMVQLYIAACFHKWDQLPDLARELVAAGCSPEELRGCVRHLVVFAGYGPCLAATLTLHKAKVLPEDTPAKAGGAPGNAFELVYDGVTDLVRKKMHAADPALGEWIRMHLYGDVYSSPGLDLRQKQLLTCSFLGVANMPDQLFGHALAGLRFGNSKAQLSEAVRLGFQVAPPTPGLDGHKREALKMLDMANAKYKKDFADQHSPPAVTIPEPSSIRIPPLPPLVNAPGSGDSAEAEGDGQGEDATVKVAAYRTSIGSGAKGTSAGAAGGGFSGMESADQLEAEPSDGVVFAWEEVDPRFDRTSRPRR